MNTIERYQVAFNKNGIFQEHIVETDRTPDEIREWYLLVHKAMIVAGIKAFDGIPKPGQPVVRI